MLTNYSYYLMVAVATNMHYSLKLLVHSSYTMSIKKFTCFVLAIVEHFVYVLWI